MKLITTMMRFTFALPVVAIALCLTAQAETAVADPVERGGPLATVEPPPPGSVPLTGPERRTRAELIRDAAASVGMTNAALLAGIGEVETGFAHCWSEATWACQGPSSSSCDGGPVIAGASDGPCSAQQGGLGMFQFDSGTFDQTIAAYGADIVTIEGNVHAVVPFLVTRAIQSVEGVTSDAEALAWMNTITIQDGDAQYEAWLYFVAWRYNGCMGCTSVINKYRTGTNKLAQEFGPEFWKSTNPNPMPVSCAPIPAAGRTIDETDLCFDKSGNASFWFMGDGGTGGGCLFTHTTDRATADNQATWQLQFDADGRYRVEVYTDGGKHGQSHQARYVVKHAGGTSEVVIDQAAGEGFHSLGEFDFVAGMPFGVTLGDNTGEPYDPNAELSIMFDAVRVVPAEGDVGGCAAGGNASGLVLVLGLGTLVLVIRAPGRSRRSARRPE
ncbi:MAG: Tryptophan synthase alpha chain [Deltaproteobacteria bacterium]|nr:Tryptophan synthase alpha chain [Deltaproteobacteria bacterium]